MTYRFNVNVATQDGADAMFKWKQWMTTSPGSGTSGGPGWSLVASSDGYGAPLPGNAWTQLTTAAAPDFSNDNITSADTLKGYLSWFVIRMPGGNATDGYKEICVQQLSKTYAATQDPSSWGVFRVKFSPSGFNSDYTRFKVPSGKSTAQRPGGSVAAIVSHSKKDEIVWGGGTDTAPSGVDFFGPGQGACKMHMMANDSDGYGLYFFTTQVGTKNIRSVVMLDPMLTGSYPDSGSNRDKQPYVLFARGYNSPGALTIDNNMNTRAIQNAGTMYYQGAFFNYGNSLETFAGVGLASPALRHKNGYLTTIVKSVTSNAHTGKDDLFPAMWVRPEPDFWGNDPPGGTYTYSGDGWPNVAFGYKGISSLLKIVSTDRSNLDTLSVASTGDRIVVNDMCLPWNGSTPSI